MKEIRTQILFSVLLVVFGALLGATWSGSRGVAQVAPPRFRECFAASVWTHDGQALRNPEWRPQTIPIAGWTPVGGAGNGANFVILCR